VLASSMFSALIDWQIIHVSACIQWTICPACCPADGRWRQQNVCNAPSSNSYNFFRLIYTSLPPFLLQTANGRWGRQNFHDPPPFKPQCFLCSIQAILFSNMHAGQPMGGGVIIVLTVLPSLSNYFLCCIKPRLKLFCVLWKRPQTIIEGPSN